MVNEKENKDENVAAGEGFEAFVAQSGNMSLLRIFGLLLQLLL